MKSGASDKNAGVAPRLARPRSRDSTRRSRRLLLFVISAKRTAFASLNALRSARLLHLSFWSLRSPSICSASTRMIKQPVSPNGSTRFPAMWRRSARKSYSEGSAHERDNVHFTRGRSLHRREARRRCDKRYAYLLRRPRPGSKAPLGPCSCWHRSFEPGEYPLFRRRTSDRLCRFGSECERPVSAHALTRQI